MKYTLKFKYLLVAAGIFIYSCNNSESKPETTESKDTADKVNEEKMKADNDALANADFVSAAVANNYAELSLAKLAGKKSKNTNIKKIASTLEKQHGEFIDQLKTYAGTHNITIPAEETAEAKEKAKTIEDDKNFDKAWCDYLVTAHQNSIKKFEDFSTKTTDESLRKWINEALPKMKMHLSMLQEQATYLEKK
ncbi:MAG: DUF4142 domain-containing protein [Ferruginibacter sp.]